MPEFVEFSPITAGEAEARADLVLVPHDSAAMRGRRTIAGERKAPRQVLFQVVLAVSCRNPPFKEGGQAYEGARKAALGSHYRNRTTVDHHRRCVPQNR